MFRRRLGLGPAAGRGIEACVPCVPRGPLVYVVYRNHHFYVRRLRFSNLGLWGVQGFGFRVWGFRSFRFSGFRVEGRDTGPRRQEELKA